MPWRYGDGVCSVTAGIAALTLSARAAGEGETVLGGTAGGFQHGSQPGGGNAADRQLSPSAFCSCIPTGYGSHAVWIRFDH